MTDTAEREAFERELSPEFISAWNARDWITRPVSDKEKAWRWWQKARAALPARAPEGWVLVPREPTPEMERVSAMKFDCKCGCRITQWGVNTWTAMLSAAPPPPEQKEERDDAKVYADFVREVNAAHMRYDFQTPKIGSEGQPYRDPPPEPIASPAPGPAEPVVRALEWGLESKHGITLQVARSLGLFYEACVKADPPGWIATFCGLEVIYAGNDEDEAKAAAQADFETRILSALQPPQPALGGKFPPPPSAEDEAARLAYEMARPQQPPAQPAPAPVAEQCPTCGAFDHRAHCTLDGLDVGCDHPERVRLAREAVEQAFGPPPPKPPAPVAAQPQPSAEPVAWINEAVRKAEIEWSYRNDNARCPVEFWHARISISPLSTDWEIFGEQEEVSLSREVKEAAEAELRATLRDCLKTLYTAPPAAPDERVAEKDWRENDLDIVILSERRNAAAAMREKCAREADRWATPEQREHGSGGPAAAIRALPLDGEG